VKFRLVEFSVIARKAGIREATLHIAFDPIRFLPGVIELDRAQPEFTRSVWDYLDNALSAQRITRGQDKLQQLGPQAVAITARYGVPTEIVVAIWGMESNYGSNFGDIPTIDALATLGFAGRRQRQGRVPGFIKFPQCRQGAVRSQPVTGKAKHADHQYCAHHPIGSWLCRRDCQRVERELPRETFSN
jgi:membrane-bound lytic murein transglycosylase B